MVRRAFAVLGTRAKGPSEQVHAILCPGADDGNLAVSQRSHQIVVPPLHLVARSRCVSLVDVLLEFFPRDHCSPWEHIRGGWVACDHDKGIRQPMAAGASGVRALDEHEVSR